jgi:hypothetical protein
MERYGRFAISSGLGMFYTVARPLADLLGKPQTAVPLLIASVLAAKLISWTVNAMLGLDPSIEIIA